MDWLHEVQDKMKRKNQIFFAKEGGYLQDVGTLLQQQNHRAMVLWAFECAEDVLPQLRERYPDENRPEIALLTAKAWAAGKVKMREAQRAILDAHAAAKQVQTPEDVALCHAIAQACSVVHTGGHGIGFPLYDLTAIVWRYGAADCREAVEARKQWYLERIAYWGETYKDYPGEWADFLMAD